MQKTLIKPQHESGTSLMGRDSYLYGLCSWGLPLLPQAREQEVKNGGMQKTFIRLEQEFHITHVARNNLLYGFKFPEVFLGSYK